MPNIIKQGLRQAFLERRASLEPAAREKASAAINNRLLESAEYERAATIAAYMPLAEEVDVRPLIDRAMDAGKKIMVPRVNHQETGLDYCYLGSVDDLEEGPYGILEPAGPPDSTADLDLIVVPALAFDMHGHRLGYGAGYYDRFLKTVEATLIGVSFDAQMIDILPVAEHDVAVDKIVTETRTIEAI